MALAYKYHIEPVHILESRRDVCLMWKANLDDGDVVRLQRAKHKQTIKVTRWFLQGTWRLDGTQQGQWQNIDIGETDALYEMFKAVMAGNVESRW